MNRINNERKDSDVRRFFELTTSNKTYVNGFNLQEIKSEILLDHTGDFELIGSMLIGELEQKTSIEFKDVDSLKNILMQQIMVVMIVMMFFLQDGCKN